MAKLGRREILRLGAAGAALGAVGRRAAAHAQATAAGGRAARPVVIASGNGHRAKNGGPRTCVEEAFLRLARGDDPLDAAVAGVNIVELDPEDDSVGYGGLPNADGVVQLDAAVMHGTRRRAGAVAALEGVRTPSLVAKAVMDETDHHLLVGAGAQAFARRMGFRVEDDLNTDNSRKKWLEWKRRIDPDHWMDPAKRGAAGERARREMMAEGLLDPEHAYGTIHCTALSSKGELACVTTTSGLPWKIPGRVGDSPILGAGLYAAGEVGSAGSTGRGEANLFNLCSFLAVEGMRRGLHPKDAALEALRRIQATTEKRLLDARGRPAFNVSFYLLAHTGEHAGVALWSSYAGRPARYAVCTERGAELLAMDSLLGEGPKT